MRSDRERRLIRKALSDDPYREDAIRSLAAAGSELAVTALRKVLAKDKNEYNRAYAAGSLAQIGTRRPVARAIPDIVKALDDPSYAVRRDAALALGELGASEAVGPLTRCLSDGDESVRWASATSLGKLRAASAVPRLIEVMADPNPSASTWAAWALGEIATPEACTALMDTLQGPGNVSPTGSSFNPAFGAYARFIRMGDTRTLPALLNHLRAYAVQDEATWAYGSGHPDLVQAAVAWGKRTATRLHVRRDAARWGEAAPGGGGSPPAPESPEPPSRAPGSRYPIANRGEWWRRLAASGWLAEVPAAEARRIKRALALQQDLSEAFAILSPAGMDVECIESDGDYSRWVVAAYRKVSCGAFKPTNVRDSLDREEERATISFELGRRRFRQEFEQPDDYVADDVHAFMNRALASLGGKRRFHFLPSGDQTVGLVCVTPKTYARARRLGLIPARVSQV